VRTATVGVRVRITSAGVIDAYGSAPDGEVEDFLIEVRGLDFGDLPDAVNGIATNDFRTRFADDGARHGIVLAAPIYLGATVDSESDGQASVNADGDDINQVPSVDDEDGVLFVTNPLIPGLPATVTVTARNGHPTNSATLFLYADFNNDGISSLLPVPFTSGDPIYTAGVSATRTFTFLMPLNAAYIGNRAFFRFRFTTQALAGDATGAYGLAADGEVEDYISGDIALFDWGDLPEPKYITDKTGGVNGASHRIAAVPDPSMPTSYIPALYIGSTKADVESDGIPSANAVGDDRTSPLDDEDLSFSNFVNKITGTPAPLIAGEPITFRIPVVNNYPTTSATLWAFIDWNADGSFTGAEESRQVTVPANTSTTFDLDYLVPPISKPDSIGIRVRLTSGDILDAYGVAPDGEVEDFIVELMSRDFGDLPDVTAGVGKDDFQTLRASDGACHAVPFVPLVYLGGKIDTEADGQPSGTGNGDDASPLQNDDEDGITFLTPIVPGKIAQFSFYAVNNSVHTAYLNVWADWDNDGTLELVSVGNSGDLILAGPGAISSSNKRIISFLVPASATLEGGKVNFRFRLTTYLGLPVAPSANGLLPDGEVEDYVVPLFKIGNLVWEDRNHNGLQDAEEINLGIPNVRLVMRFGGVDPQTGVLDSVTQNTIADLNTLVRDSRPGDQIVDYVSETHSDARGLYGFTGMIEGFYQIISADTFGLTPTRFDWIKNVTEEDRDSDGKPLKNPWDYATGERRQSKSQEWKLTAATIGTDEDGNLDQGNPQLPDPNQVDDPLPDNRVEQRIDFGYTGFDFGDLAQVGNNPSILDFNTEENGIGGRREGAKHIVTPDLRLGRCQDVEWEGQSDSDAGAAFNPAADMSGDDPIADFGNYPNFPYDPSQGRRWPFHQGGSNDCGDDEDGIRFNTPLIAGYDAQISLRYQAKLDLNGPDAYLHAWFDWNGDGNFYDTAGNIDPDEHIIFTALNGGAISLEPNTKAVNLEMSYLSSPNDSVRLAFRVPKDVAYNNGNILARFRISFDPRIGPDGILSPNLNFPDPQPGAASSTVPGGIVPFGEVEDYFIALSKVGNLVWEDRNYNGLQDTLEPPIANVRIRLEFAGVDGVFGSGDPYEYVYFDTTDASGKYDFCGLIGNVDPSGIPNPTYRLLVYDPAGMTATYNTPDSTADNCLDNNSNGDDKLIEDRITADTFTISNPMMLCVDEEGKSDVGGLSPGNNLPPSPDALNRFPDNQHDETRDFAYVGFDYGDLPGTAVKAGSAYPTLRDSVDVAFSGRFGARHAIQPRLFLGKGVDTELNGQPDDDAGSNAVGSQIGDDDNQGLFVKGANGDDENGVLLLSPLLPGERAFIKVNYTAQDTVNGSYVNRVAFLDAFVDWNGNGAFDLPGEKLRFTHQMSSSTTFNTNNVPSIPSGPVFTASLSATGPTGSDSTILAFDVPNDAVFDSGMVYMRFRLGWTNYGDSYPNSFPVYGLGPDNNAFHMNVPPFVKSTPPFSDVANHTGRYPYPLGEVEDYGIPVAKIGNLAWYDHDVFGDQDIGEDYVDSLHLVLIWGGINPSSGKPDTVGYQTALASAGSVTDILYNKTSVPPQVSSYLPNGGIQLTGNGQGSGRYSFRGLIPGHYYLIPQKYLIPDSAQSVLHWPPFRVLTLQDNPGTPDVLDSDGRVGSSTGPRGPGALLQIADSNPLFPEVAVADRPLNENSPLADSLESALPFFPDNQWDQTIDLGWVDLPNVEANLDIVGVDFPASETCGNFNVKMDLCVKNPTEVPLDSFMITLDLARAYGDAFVGFLGTSIVDSAYSVETRDIKRPKSMFGAKDALTPFLNPGYNGDTDINLFRPQGSGGQRWNDVSGQGAFFLPGDSVFCVRVIFEVDSRKEVTFRSNTPKGWYSQGRVTARAVGFENGTGAKRAVQDLRLFDPRNPSAPNPNLGSPIVVEDLTDEIDDPKYKRTIPHPDAGDNVAFEGSVADRTYDPRLKNKYEDGDNKTIQNDSCWIRTAVSAAYQNINLVMDSKCESLLPLDKVLPGTFADCGFDRYPEGSYYRMIIQDEDTGETIWTSNSRIPFDAIKYFGRRLSYKLRNVVKSCELAWGRLTLEDKTKPIPICPISPANRRVDTSNLAFVPNALPFVCTDVDKVLRVERSWKDPAYEYFTGLATAVDSCGEVFLEKVSDQLLLYPECSASMANQYMFAKILRTFFFTDSYGNEDTCIQTILFARPKIVLPECKILVSNAVAKGDSTLNPSDLIRKYNLPESVPYFLDGAGRRHYLTEEKALCLFEISYTDENVYGIGGCGRKIVRRWILQDFCWTPSPAYPDYLTLPTSDSSCYAGKSWAKNRYEWEQYLVIGDETKPLVYVPDFDKDGFKGSGYPASLPNFLHPTSVATSSYDPGDFLLLGTNASECKGNLKFTRDMLIVLGETSWCFDIRLVARKPVLDLDEQPTGRFKLVAEPGVSIFGNCTSGFDIIGVPVPRDTNTSYFIEARVFDACGRDSTVFVPLRIADLTAPVVKCRDELRLSLDNTGRANASVANLHVGSWDNCGNVAWTKIRRPVENCTSEWMQINGFVDSNKNAKIDPDIDYIDENKNQRPEEWEYFRLNRVNGKLMSPLLDRLSFFCCDQDTVLVEIFTEDRAGNRDYCSSRVILEDKAPIQYVLPAPRTLFCTEAKSDLDNIPGSGEFAETTPAYRALTNILKSDILVLRNEQCRPIQKSVLVEYDMYCESGSIKVSWKLVNKSGSYVQTVVTQPVGISVLPSYEYNLTFPPDATGNCKILTDTANVADGGELSCSKLSVSVQDKRYLATSLQINNPSCYKVFRTYVASDECASSNECGEPAKWAVIVPRDPDGNGPDGVNVLVRDRFKGVENPQIPGTGLSGAPGSDGWEEIYFEDFCGKGKNYTGEACESVLAQGPRSDTGRFMSYVNPQGPCLGSNMAREHMAWLFTQILEVRDTTPPVVSGPNRLSFGLSKDNCRADVHITFSGQDDCSLISGISSDSSQSGRMYVHQVELVSGLSAPLSLGNLPIEMGAVLTSSDTLGNTWSFSASLEEGEYSLIVTLRDGCGNISRRHPFTFQVVDTSAPTPLCFNGFSIALGSKANLTGGEATFWATDLMVRPVGDCNGQSDSVLVDGKKRVDLYYVAKDLNGDGVFDAQDSLNAKGFPLLPAKKATLLCEDLQGDSTHLVKIRLYSMDNRGNWAWCESFVQVSDPLSLCSRKTNTANIFGAISTESGIFVPGVAVDLTGISSSTFVTGKDGQFQFSRIEAGRDVSVSALLDKNHAEGVSTFDLFLLNRHIIGTKLLETPLQMIAADVNNSKSITVMDLVQLRKLVLGMADRFEGNTSWRFLDAAYVFTDTASVLEKQYPEVLNFNNVSGSLKADFRAVKIGDINGSALKESPQVRSAKGFQMDVPDAQMTKGQEYTIAFSMRQLNSFVGYQFTLAWNTQLVAFIEVLPNLSSKDNFGFFIPEGLLTTTYFAEKAHEGDTLFRIRVKALSNCRSSEVFSVNSRITSAEAYQISGEPVPVTLDFVPDIPKKQGFTLLQNTPNPFRTETQIPFLLPEACEATIVVQDISGKVLATFNGRFAKGLNTVVWHSENRKASGISGVFFYTLTTDGFSETRKMIRIE
jgi:hypothetical protein